MRRVPTLQRQQSELWSMLGKAQREKEQRSNPFFSSQDPELWCRVEGVGRGRPSHCKLPCCFPLQKCLSIHQPHLCWRCRTPPRRHMTLQGPHSVGTQPRACLWLETARKHTYTRFLSLKGSRRNSVVPPRQSGIQTGSLWIAGHSPAKLPQSVLSPWREILRRRASRGSSGAHGCVRASRGRAETTPKWPTFAQTLCRAASKPSRPPPQPVTSDGQICVRLFWWSLGPLKNHKAQK